MPDIGVRHLKTHASEIIRQVREQRARYVITLRGKPVGLLMPVDEASPALSQSVDSLTEPAWDALTRLGEEIGREWCSPPASCTSHV